MNKPGANHPPYDPQLKATVICAVKDEDMSVREAAEEYGVTTKTIYRWLRGDVANTEGSLILENNRLKQEQKQLRALLSRARAEMKQ